MVECVLCASQAPRGAHGARAQDDRREAREDGSTRGALEAPEGEPAHPAPDRMRGPCPLACLSQVSPGGTACSRRRPHEENMVRAHEGGEKLRALPRRAMECGTDGMMHRRMGRWSVQRCQNSMPF
jgi:hypothetical protein